MIRRMIAAATMVSVLLSGAPVVASASEIQSSAAREGALAAASPASAASPVRQGPTEIVSLPDRDAIALSPARLVDSRVGLGVAGRLAAGQTVDVSVVGVGGVPAVGVGTVYLNVTAVGPAGSGYVTVFPRGDVRPTASNVNYAGEEYAVPNMVVARVGRDGMVSVFNFGSSVDLVIDVMGWAPEESADGARLAVPASTVVLGNGDVMSITSEKGSGRVVLSGSADTVNVDEHIVVLRGPSTPTGYVGRVIGIEAPGVLLTTEVALHEAVSDFAIESAATNVDARIERAGSASYTEASMRNSLLSIARKENWGCVGDAGSLVAEITSLGVSNAVVDVDLYSGGIFAGGPQLAFLYQADFSVGFDLGVQTSVSCAWEGPGLSFMLPTSVPIEVEIEPFIEFSGSGQVGLSVELTRRVQISFIANAGGVSNRIFRLFDRPSSVDLASGSGELSLFVGVNLEVELFGKVGVEAAFGPRLTASVGTGSPCVVIELSLGLDLSLELELWIELERQIASFDIPLADLYRGGCVGAPPVASPTPPTGSTGGGPVRAPVTPRAPAASGPLSFSVSPQRCSTSICNSLASAQRGVMSGFTPNSAVAIRVVAPNGADANTLSAPYRYIATASTDGAGQFTWRYWWEPGMDAGTYRTEIRDVATGRIVSTVFEYVSAGGVNVPSVPSGPGQISLSRGAANGAASWYSVVLSGFAPGSSVTVTCRDTADPGGFWTQTFTISASGTASDSTLCFSADGGDHWVTGGGVESNRVAWGAATTPPPVTTVPPGPARISLSRGAANGAASWYSVVLSGFAPGSSVTVTCRDTADPGGFWTQTFVINSAGQASDSTLCFSADGGDHWVTGGGVESNRVAWGAATPPPTTPPPTTPPPVTTVPLGPPRISLSRGAANGAASWYSVVLSGFAPGSSVTVTCRDTADPGGFWTQTFVINSAGQASDSTLCFSADGGDHWVTGGGVESNRVAWGAATPPPTTPPPTTAPPAPAPTPRISLSRGTGFWYSVVLSGFAPGSSVTVTCRDTADPGGFWTQTFVINGAGQASDTTLCYSADSGDHWVTGGGVESNRLRW